MPIEPASNFTLTNAGAKERLICSVSGRDKTGKTSFALSAPGPLYVCNFDMGLEGVIEKYMKEKEIYVASYRYSRATRDKSEAEDAYRRFEQDYYYGLSRGASVVVDTASEMWEVLRMARFGKLAQVMPHHYGPVNAEVRELVRAAFDSSANVIFLHKRKAVYVNDKRTGDYEMAGFGDMPYLVQVNLVAEYLSPTSTFKLTVENCRHNMRLAGMELTDDEINFDTVKEVVFNG